MQFVVQGFVAAQTRTHHQHGIDGLIQSLDRLLHIESTQAHGVLLGNYATALHRCDHGPTHVDQALHRGARMAGTTAQPQQGPLCGLQLCRQRIELCSAGGQGGQRQRRHIGGQVQQLGLHIDGDFNADRSTRWGVGQAVRLAQNAQSTLGIADAKRRFAHRREHGQLRRGFMDVTPIAVHILRFNLTGQMQHGCARGQGLHQSPCGIARTGASAGDANAPSRAHTGGCIGHVACAGFATRRHKTHLPALMHGVQDRHVVNGNHAVGGFHPRGFHKPNRQFSHGDSVGSYFRGTRRGCHAAMRLMLRGLGAAGWARVWA